ncbi:rhomboid family intramembrane serine protease [Marinoscillum furvescens]|uniref:Membrane associated rhomboid family serine protease n=1 Tax=Marinoscillum furvescens DSM 4134 TaxID=1122208 RepID=A0A3D9L7P4_MARFU|nr:rhomboid family intramembrane serine protease [Marinoscillum furvescens]REE01505.1 membrane associated rhomboid family serine protease [Marinoscillum furvescens DSM 4134]
MNNSILDDFKNAWNKPNNAPAQLIIINVIVFLFLGVLMVVSRLANFEVLFDVVYDQFSIPPLLSDFILRPWTLFTYAFAHSLSGIFHILFNMLVFYWFSRLILEFLGNNKVIAIYVLGALAGGVAYLLVYNLIPFYQDTAPGITGMVGASAAVYATVVAAAVFMPNYTFFLLFLGPVRIKYIAAFYVVISFLGSTGGNAGGNIAHLGGALMGWLYIAQLRNGTDLGTWIIATMNWFKSFFVPSPKIKVTHRSAPKQSKARKSAASSAKTEQEEIDAILDKISQSGYDSLTKEEKQKLFNASKK